MKKLLPTILFCLFLAACQTTDQEPKSHYETISEQMEQLKAQGRNSQSGNIKVSVNFLTTSQEEYSSVNSLLRYVDQNFQLIHRPAQFNRTGLKIGFANNNFKAALSLAVKKLKSSEQTDLFILVSDNNPGYITIGREIYVPRFYYRNRWYSYIEYDFRQARRSLKVTARKLPDGLIEMELTPVFSNFLNNAGDLELTELSTRIIAAPNQTIVIAGSTQQKENIASALLSHGKNENQKQTLITVTPYLQ